MSSTQYITQNLNDFMIITTLSYLIISSCSSTLISCHDAMAQEVEEPISNSSDHIMSRRKNLQLGHFELGVCNDLRLNHDAIIKCQFKPGQLSQTGIINKADLINTLQMCTKSTKAKSYADPPTLLILNSLVNATIVEYIVQSDSRIASSHYLLKVLMVYTTMHIPAEALIVLGVKVIIRHLDGRKLNLEYVVILKPEASHRSNSGRVNKTILLQNLT